MAEASILIAEDEAIIALDIQRTLESQGYVVSAIASSAGEAVRKATETEPDLVLMDIALKGEGSGVEAAERISTQLQIPIVYITGHADGPTLEKAKATTPFGYIVKPLEDRELHATVEMTLQRHAMERRLQERERWLAATLGSISDAVITTDRDGAVTFMNPPAEDLTGWGQGEALGTDWREVLTLVDASTGSPVELALAQAVQEGEHGGEDDRVVIARDGTRTVVDGRITAIRGEPRGTPQGYVLSFRDISERLCAQRALERRVAQLALVNDIGQRIAATLELDAILDRSARLLREGFGYHHVALFMLDPEEDEVALRAGAGAGVEEVLPGYRQNVTEGIVGWVARRGETVLVNDVDADPRYIRAVPHVLRTRSELAVPIQVHGEAVGVLDVQSPRLNAFDAADVTVMETVADQIGLAIWRGRLYGATEKRSERLAVLNQVSSAVFSSLEPETVMASILDVARQAFEAPEGSILMRDRCTGELVFALTSSVETGENLALNGVRLKPGQGIAGWVVEHDEAVVVDDVRDDPRWYSGVDGVSGFETRCLMSAPLKRRNEIIGALEIVSERKGAFTDRDLSLLEAVCSIAAVGLDNARLYAAMRAHADRLALLHQLGQALSSTLDYDAVIHSALSKVLDIFSADGVWFVKPDGGSGGLQLAAGLTQHISLQEPAALPSDQGVAAWALKHGEPVLVEDAPRDDRFSRLVDQQLGIQTRVMMVSPLATTDRLLGVIAVSSSEPEAYERGDLSTLQAIAATTSIALENANLYENLKAVLREREKAEARLIQSEKMAALGRLLASITHEVNNPLQAIQGCLTLAREELVGRRRQEKLQRYVEVASNEIEHIANIVRRTRAFYRPDLGGPRLIDVHAVLDSVLSLSSKQLQYNDIVVKRDWASDLPRITANTDQLRQVFLNLVLNSIDAMPGGGTLRVRTSLHVPSEANQGAPDTAVRIQFSDTGVGIPAEVKPHIFEPFVTTKDKGSGLGLFVAYGAVQAHGGEITVSSEPDQGTTFTVLLPVKRARG